MPMRRNTSPFEDRYHQWWYWDADEWIARGPFKSVQAALAAASR